MALDWFLPYLQNDLKNFFFVHAMPKSQMLTNQPIPQKDPKIWGRCFWACFSYFISISISLRLCSALCNCGVLPMERSHHEKSQGAELYEANTGLKHVKIDPKPRKNCAPILMVTIMGWTRHPCPLACSCTVMGSTIFRLFLSKGSNVSSLMMSGCRT